ncbi:hypothetical protein [Aquisphaera insulae]|uniref:hypothetical protein n=1 Tax=Aquisphaera insulae TaxID=2712864 RepID=UPI0013EB47BB|nr:hypothetical protein [Aquisphaera insulae]
MKVTRSTFQAQRTRRFGVANPERMRLAFWERMVRDAEAARADEEAEIETPGAGRWRTPYDVRCHFGLDGDYSVGPIWCFDRMGMSRTELADGRTIYITKKHKDYYDPDFCIYNDVVILRPGGSVEIYGYPEDLFPPTDFHTATLVGGRLILIGRVGYNGKRHPGTTPVFALDVSRYRIEPMSSRGEVPGWIFGHEAEFDPARGAIVIRGGEVEAPAPDDPSKRVIRRNFDEYAYHMDAAIWERLTTKGWRHFSIRLPRRKRFSFSDRPDLMRELMRSIHPDRDPAEDIFTYIEVAAIMPETIAYQAASLDPHQGARITVDGVPVSIGNDAGGIEIIVEGDLGGDGAEALAREILRRVEADCGRSCILETLA